MSKEHFWPPCRIKIIIKIINLYLNKPTRNLLLSFLNKLFNHHNEFNNFLCRAVQMLREAASKGRIILTVYRGNSAKFVFLFYIYI